MSERISSSLTFFYKFIFSSGWVVGFGLGTLVMIKSPAKEDMALFFGVMWVLGSAFIYWSCAGLKRIEINDGNIIVSNYLKIITIKGSDIHSVSQNRFISTRPITIRLKIDTIFGRNIVFMPKYYFRLFSEDKVVTRLRNLAIYAK